MTEEQNKNYIDACEKLGLLLMQKTAGAMGTPAFDEAVAPLLKEAAAPRGLLGSIYERALGKRFRNWGDSILKSTADANTAAEAAARAAGQQNFNTVGGVKRFIGDKLYRAGMAHDARAAGFKVDGDIRKSPFATGREYDAALAEHVAKSKAPAAQQVEKAVEEQAQNTITPPPNPVFPQNTVSMGLGNAALAAAGLLGTGAIGLKAFQNNKPRQGMGMMPMAMPMMPPMMPMAMPVPVRG